MSIMKKKMSIVVNGEVFSLEWEGIVVYDDESYRLLAWEQEFSSVPTLKVDKNYEARMYAEAAMDDLMKDELFNRSKHQVLVKCEDCEGE